MTLTQAERDRAEVLKAQEAMDNGADDSRWRPGETAVDALIRERDELLGELITLRALVDSRHLPDALLGRLGLPENLAGDK